MKKLALLLAAMGVISAAAFAGSLQVTGINQELEYEHENAVSENDVTFTTTVNMKYDDWSFGIQGGKMWQYGTKGADKKGLSSNNGRLQLDVWKSITPEFKLGYRFRGQKNMDRHYVRYTYAQDWFTSAADIWFESTNDSNNNKIKMELFPIGVKYNGFTAKWFVNYVRNIKSVESGEKSYYEHQIRVHAPIYSDDALSLGIDGRFTLAAGKSVKGGEEYRHYKNFGRTRLDLVAGYKVTESFDVYGKYGYEFRSMKYKNGGSEETMGKAKAKSYQHVVLGWNYTF